MTVLNAYLDTLAAVTAATEVSGRSGERMALDAGVAQAIESAKGTHAGGNKIIIVGNGGSAGIASHTAIDYSKNGQMRAMAFGDSAALTCLGNDFGYEHVYAKQVEYHGRAGDLLIAISSSGRSPNILNATDAARKAGIGVITFSGFKPDNPLRTRGELNFYAPSGEYGFVEIAHQTLLHALLDIKIGWRPAA